LYQPRHKENSALRQILLHSLQATRKALEAAEVYLPRLAWRELDAIIDYGVLEKGFRARRLRRLQARARRRIFM